MTEPSFEERMKQLEEIVRLLEAGDLDLEAAVQRYEKGIALVQTLQGHLADMEKRIEVLTTGDRVRPFDDADVEEGDGA